MQCEFCHQAPATTHVKRTINGHTDEKHLCASCAAQQGVPGLSSHPLELSHFWSSLFSNKIPSETQVPPQTQMEHCCTSCGITLAALAQSGQTGCPACYTTFREQLLPSLQRIHGKTGHVGKFPTQTKREPAVAGSDIAQTLAQLRQKLADCIAAQQYEACAALRDQITALEDKGVTS